MEATIGVKHSVERLLRALIDGDRAFARAMVDAMADRFGPGMVLERLLWPVCEALHELSRRDAIAAVAERGSSVLLAQLVQRVESRWSRATTGATKAQVLVTSGPAPFEELGGEIFAALAEAAGFQVTFLAGGVESDDLLAEVGRRQPDFLVSFAAAGTDAPRLRRFLIALRTQQPVPGLRVGVGAGVFGRAPGLAEEFGADFEGRTPSEVVAAMLTLCGPRTGRGAGSRRAA